MLLKLYRLLRCAQWKSRELDDSQLSELFRCFQEVLEQRDVQPLFVNVIFEEMPSSGKNQESFGFGPILHWEQ